MTLEKEIRIPLFERLSYAASLGGQNLMYTYVNFFIMIFYTDVMGILPAAAGMIFLVARIWDAVNDPMMGLLVDQTRSRWGKCRPYLIFMALPIGLATTVLFFVPHLPPHGRLVYAWITYLIWGMIYTSGDIPLWTLSGRISPLTEHRTKLISWARVAGAIGTALAVLLTVPLKDHLARSDTDGYLAVAAVFSLVGVLLIFQGGLVTRERSGRADHERLRLFDSLKGILTNGPLMLVLLSFLIGVLPSLQGVTMMYFAKYNLHNEGLMMIIAGINLAATAVGSGLVPTITKLIDGKRLVILSGALGAVLGIVMYFVGWGSIALFYLFALIWGLLNGFPAVIRTTMIANTVEWMETRTGKRSDGAIFSTLTFIGKLTAGIGPFIASIVLSTTGYVANVEQTPRALNGIFMTMTLLPGIGSLLMVIPLFFYKIDDQTHRKLVGELNL